MSSKSRSRLSACFVILSSLCNLWLSILFSSAARGVPRKRRKHSRPSTPRPASGCPDTYPVSGWEDCDAALVGGRGRRDRASTHAARGDRAVPDAIRRSHRSRARRRSSSRRISKPRCRSRRASPTSSCRARRASFGRPPMRRSKVRGRFRRSTRRIRFDRASSRSVRSWCSARTIFHTRFPASPAAISRRPSPQAIPSSAKAHPLHPGTGRLLAEAAVAALSDAGLPPATVQMIYKIDHQSGQRLVSDPAWAPAHSPAAAQPAWR